MSPILLLIVLAQLGCSDADAGMSGLLGPPQKQQVLAKTGSGTCKDHLSCKECVESKGTGILRRTPYDCVWKTKGQNAGECHSEKPDRTMENGWLSEEFHCAIPKLAVGKAQMTAKFAKIDTNHDNFISREEMNDASLKKDEDYSKIDEAKWAEICSREYIKADPDKE